MRSPYAIMTVCMMLLTGMMFISPYPLGDFVLGMSIGEVRAVMNERGWNEKRSDDEGWTTLTYRLVGSKSLARNVLSAHFFENELTNVNEWWAFNGDKRGKDSAVALYHRHRPSVVKALGRPSKFDQASYDMIEIWYPTDTSMYMLAIEKTRWDEVFGKKHVYVVSATFTSDLGYWEGGDLGD